MKIAYKDLIPFSKSIGISSEHLVKAFEIETEFHRKIIEETSRQERLKLYDDVYTKVHSIYKDGALVNEQVSGKPPRGRKSRLFSKEVANKSVLEIGCGRGAFLMALADLGIKRDLYGMDVTIPDDDVAVNYPNVEFIKADITKFKMDHKFDVIYSNHVFEHIAPADIDTHLSSIHAGLEDDGVLIINAPNKIFGPSDITRIVDFSYTNRTPALGTHLNEPTYTEIIETLKSYGFTNFRTTFPNVYLRHLIPDYRMGMSFMYWLEKSPKVISLLHKLKYKGKCIASLEVTIICDKKNISNI
jgi:2-polyprenyl-3-methyl-5-hydroxy-6-metoxy-1,4-benzoquinol methylase